MGTVHCRGGPWSEGSVPLGEQGLRSLYMTLPAGVWSRRLAATAQIGVAPLLPIEVGRRTPGWHNEFLRLIPESITYPSGHRLPGTTAGLPYRVQMGGEAGAAAKEGAGGRGLPLPAPGIPISTDFTTSAPCHPKAWPLPSATVEVWNTTPSRAPSYHTVLC